MVRMTATEAKQNFGEFIEKALQHGVIVTRNGRDLLEVRPKTPPTFEEAMDRVFKAHGSALQKLAE